MTVPAAPAAPEVTPPPAAPAAPAATPAPEAAPAPAKRLSPEDVLANFDKEFEAAMGAAAGEEETDDAPAETPEPKKKGDAKEAADAADAAADDAGKAEEPEPEEGEWEEGVVPPNPEDTLPSKERAALKKIDDPSLRRQFARAHYLVKAYERSGMRLGDIKRYVAAAPTPEVLEERIGRADQLDAFVDEFSSADPASAARVLEVLRQTSGDGFGTMMDLISENLPALLPKPKLRQVGNQFFRAVVANMREDADENGDLVLADIADGVEKYLGLTPEKKGRRGEAGRDKAPEDPEAARKLQRADEILKQDEERRRQEAQQRLVTFNEAVTKDAVSEAANFAKEWIEENCGAYRNEVKRELYSRLYTTVRGHVENNSVVQKNLRNLINEGSGDEAHRARVAQYLVKTIKSVFVTVAPGVLTEIQRIAGPAQARRAERVDRAKSARNVGGSGGPVVAGEQRLTGKGKHPEDVLKEFDALPNG